MTARRWDILAGGGVLLHVALSCGYAAYGRINADEGWYLQAAREVARGGRPYRDFAFPQMPLVPYLHALPQRLCDGSVAAGRGVSVVLSLAAVALAAVASRQRWGPQAGAIAALLGGSFAYGAYHLAIVKTYAPAALLAVGSFAAAARGRPGWALAWALAAGTARLPFLATAVPLAIHALRHARGAGGRAAILLGCLAPAALVIGLAGGDARGAAWHVVGRHWIPSGGSGGGRAPSVLQVHAAHAVLLATAAAWAWRRGGRTGGADSLVPYAAGLALGAASNLAASPCLAEHAVPFLYAAFPLATGFVVRAGREGGGAVPGCLLAAVLVVVPGTQGDRFIDRSGGTPPIRELREVAGRIAARTPPGGRVLALSALCAVVESGRDVPRGASLAQFSVAGLPEGEARRRHLLTREEILRMIAAGGSAAIALTASDRDLLEGRRPGAASPDGAVDRALAEGGYRCDLRRERFGPFDETVEVWVKG